MTKDESPRPGKDAYCISCGRHLLPAPPFYTPLKNRPVCVVCTAEETGHEINASGDRIGGARVRARARLLRYTRMKDWRIVLRKAEASA